MNIQYVSLPKPIHFINKTLDTVIKIKWLHNKSIHIILTSKVLSLNTLADMLFTLQIRYCSKYKYLQSKGTWKYQFCGEVCWGQPSMEWHNESWS